jgi:hypothetical protein
MIPLAREIRPALVPFGAIIERRLAIARGKSASHDECGDGQSAEQEQLQDFTMNEPRKGVGAVGRSVGGHIPVRRCRTISSA